MDFPTFLSDLLQRAVAAAPRVGEPAGPLASWAANLLVLRSVPSTNALGRRIVDEYLQEGVPLPRAVLVAWGQSAGAGRLGRSWVSPAGRGAYLSLVRPVADGEELPTLPLLVPVAVARALERWLGEGRCRIKWPNDLLVDGRKIAGVLLAGVGGSQEDAAGGVVIGVGVNHGQGADELAGVSERGATSMTLECAEPPALPELVWGLVVALADELEHAGEGERAARRYQELSLHNPGDHLRCRAADGTVEGIFRGFDERGFLRLELTAGSGDRLGGEEVLVTAGEVTSP